SWRVNELIERHHPNLVIVQLGDAMAGYDAPQMPRTWIADQVHALTGRLRAHSLPCMWVGPMWGREGPPYQKSAPRVKELSAFLAETVAPCRFIDSTAF